MAPPTTRVLRRRGLRMHDDDPAGVSTANDDDEAKLGASAPSKGKQGGTKGTTKGTTKGATKGTTKGTTKDTTTGTKAKRVPSATKYLPPSKPWTAVRGEFLKRIGLFCVCTVVAVYLRAIPLRAIPGAFQNRVEKSIPPWLNSSMHLLNGNVPALNYTSFGNARKESPSPGALAKKEGRTPKHPVVIVPGFVSSGLELWEGLTCGKHFFRQRM